MREMWWQTKGDDVVFFTVRDELDGVVGAMPIDDK